MDIVESVADGLARSWKLHTSKPSFSKHEYALKNEGDGKLTLHCKNCSLMIGHSNPLGNDYQGKVQEQFKKFLARP